MEEYFESACTAIQERYQATRSDFRGETTLFIAAEHNVEVLADLKKEFHFEMLLDITAVDYWPQETPRFHLLYRLYSFNDNARLLLRIPLDGNAPSIRTVEGVFKNATWYEREVWDLMGITFDGLSDPRRILMPESWQGHPLRKDYPLGYEEVQFTFNADEIQVRKNAPTR